MIKSVLFLLTSLVLFPCLCFSQPFSSKQTSVVGFLNYGDEADDDINIVMTKSLTAFLSKLPEASITAYDDIEKTAVETRFWKSKKFDAEAAIRTAQMHGAKQMIAGYYLVNKKNKKIEIHVFVYDVVTAELRLQRVYKGATDIGLFDTIEKMQRSVAGLLYGRDFTFGKLSISVTNSPNEYLLYISGKQTASLTAAGHFEESFVADEEMELSIRLSNSGNEVFRKRVAVKKDKITQIVYKPAGVINIKSMGTNIAVFLDGTNSGGVNKEGICSIPDVPAGIPHMLVIKQGETELDRKEVNVGEGSSEIIVFDKKILIRENPVKNTGASIYYNLLLPGIVQIQAGDPYMGYLFLGLDAASIGFSIYSYINFHDNYVRLIIAADAASQEKALNASVTWRNLFLASLAVWACNTVLSVVHAGYLPDFRNSAFNNPPLLNLIVKTDEIRMECRFSF